MTLQDAWKVILVRGPSEVMVTRTDTVSPAEAMSKYRTGWDVIYIRDDGWSLAAPYYFAHYAENLHKGRWIGRVRRGDKSPKEMT